jgi:hypothetical protein
MTKRQELIAASKVFNKTEVEKREGDIKQGGKGAASDTGHVAALDYEGLLLALMQSQQGSKKEKASEPSQAEKKILNFLKKSGAPGGAQNHVRSVWGALSHIPPEPHSSQRRGHRCVYTHECVHMSVCTTTGSGGGKAASKKKKRKPVTKKQQACIRARVA